MFCSKVEVLIIIPISETFCMNFVLVSNFETESCLPIAETLKEKIHRDQKATGNI